MLHPRRRPVTALPRLPHRDFAVESEGATLRGWLFPSPSRSGGPAIVILHGVADNRESGVWIAERLVPAGHDVVVYDSRAHGASSGDACTYGFLEKRDLSRVLGRLSIERAIVVGSSLGGAVALQAAADDPRIVAVVAVAAFSDLETIARERAPWFASARQVRDALDIAQREGRFELGAVSPVRAAARIHVPVLLVHGEEDGETPVAHSERVFAALAGPRWLRIVPGAGHGDALARVWAEVEAWISDVRVAALR
jgi:uncharacterized protein